MIEIEMPDGVAEAYAAGTGPGVLFFIDAIGLRPQIETMVDRIASWGYGVLAPNVFYRAGRAVELAPTQDLREPGAREEFFASLGSRIPDLTPELIARDLPAYLAALRGLRGIADGGVGATGYCMGARIAVRAAAQLPDDVVAVGGFHGGGLVTDEPTSPHLGLPQARAAFVFGHADQDRSMPPEAVATLGEALTEAGLTHANEIYGGAPHGYTMADTSMYDAAGAERHFTALRVLLATTLG